MNIDLPKELSKEELVSMLKDPLPLADPAFFPLGIFWLLLIMGSLLWVLYKLVMPKGKKAAAKYLAGREFSRIYNDYNSTRDAPEFLKRIARLVRRVGVQAYGYEAIADLHGEAWAGFIRANAKDAHISADNAEVIATAPYRRDGGEGSLNVMELYKQAYDWSMAQL